MKNFIKILLPSVFVGLFIFGISYAVSVCYPYQGCTGTSTVPVKGDLLVGSSSRIYSVLSSSTNAYSLLTVSSTAPYGLGWSTQIGASTNRLDAFLDDLDATTLTIGGTASGDLNMGNYNILNANQIKANYFNATSTTATSTFSGPIVGGGAQFIIATTTDNILLQPYGGNVGIASTTPSTILAVQGNIIGSGNIVLYGTATSTFGGGLTVDTNTLYVLADSNNVVINGVTSINNNALNVKLAAGQTEAIRADGTVAGTLFQDTANYSYFLDPANTGTSLKVAGSVGIATTSPRYKLDVWGDLAIGTSTDTNTPALFVDSGNGGRIGIGTTTLAGLFTVGTTTPRLVVAPDGRVGIATSTPSDTFAVQGTSFFSATTSIADGLVVGGNKLFVSQGGNVGIGTTAPTAKLTVAGGIIGQASSTFIGNIDSIGNITISSSTASLFQPIWGSDDGLVLYLPFSEGMTSSSASTIYDRSPYGHDGTAVNMPMPTRNATSGESGWATTTSKCKVPGCMAFDGANDRITSSGSAALAFTDTFSVEAWVNLSSSPPAAHQWLFYLVTGDGIRVSPRRNAAGNYFAYYNPNTSAWIESNVSLPLDVFSHIVVNIAPANGTSEFFVNGALVRSVAGDAFPSMTGDFEIGAVSGTQPLKGIVDELRVYNRALSEAEVRTHYLRGVNANSTIIANKFRIIGTDNNVGFQINSSSTAATTTAIIGSLGNPACLKIRDTANGGWTYCRTSAGTLTCNTSSCE